MNLSIVNHKLQIEFTFKEQLLAVRFNKFWQISLAHIEEVTTAKPQINWRELRAPGTSVPGVIKAGTYYTKRGKEFWYVNRETNYLTIQLRDESYKWIILTIDNNESWQQRLAEIMAA